MSLTCYKKQKSLDFSMPKPIKPLEKMLIIPANNSATGVFQLLSENEGSGLLFETEGDTLACTFKSDYSNYHDPQRREWFVQPLYVLPHEHPTGMEKCVCQK